MTPENPNPSPAPRETEQHKEIIRRLDRMEHKLDAMTRKVDQPPKK